MILLLELFKVDLVQLQKEFLCFLGIYFFLRIEVFWFEYETQF